MFAGTAGSVPSARRGLPALLVRRGAERILIDCGEGTQRQLLRSVGLSRSDRHLHHAPARRPLARAARAAPDLQPARQGPPAVDSRSGGHRRVDASMRRVYGRLGFELEVVELEAGEAVRRDTLEIGAVQRRATASLPTAMCSPRTPVRAVSTPSSRSRSGSAGPDFGRLQRGDGRRRRARKVIGPERPGRSRLLRRHAPCETLAIAAHGADLLVHEATFGEDERDRAARDGALDRRAGCADRGRCGREAAGLTHISARYGGGELREEARASLRRPSCRATSTRSRSRSRTAGCRRSFAAGEGMRPSTPVLQPLLDREAASLNQVP